MKKLLPYLLKFSGLILILYFPINMVISNHNNSKGIGIIGGADAPTAVFLTSALFKTTPLPYIMILGIVLLITGIIIGRKNKNE